MLEKNNLQQQNENQIETELQFTRQENVSLLK